ncbi:MAG: WhiB family transcriptional regulator [Proteobacteria bacterium]|nr:WhiB family transcriptional regulator [Pseudomonadota bacterium]
MTTMDDTLRFDALEVPVLDERPWAVFAACTETPDVSFFPQTKDEERAALAICTICPVREDCLEHAIETRERFGVWGGLTEKERKKVSRLA